MSSANVPSDQHPTLDPGSDTQQRGTTPTGAEDPHPHHPFATLPPVDTNYRQSDVNDRIDRLLVEAPRRHRTQTLFPFLYMRAVPGDRGGNRPLWPPVPCWESPDIHLLPAGTTGFDFAKTVLNPVAGRTYRLLVHVWNLGRFAAFGARLRAWWVEPGFFAGTQDPRYQPHFIGGAYFDLGDRDSGRAHRLIELQPAWTVQMNQPAHECLIVAVECGTDPWDGEMNSNTHRHVAQRNLTLIAGTDNLAPAIGLLGEKFGAAQQLAIGYSAVDKANLAGAAARGQSSQRETLRGWDHTALNFGGDTRPLAAVRPGPDGLQFFDLRDRPVMPDPATALDGGEHVDGPLDQALPGLFQRALAVPTLSGLNVASVLTGVTRAAVLRFALTEQGGNTAGYSMVAAPFAA
jgi:hypothetical protein